MVTFSLQKQNDSKARYYYYPENDRTDYGIIDVDLVKQDINVIKSHDYDYQTTITLDDHETVKLYAYASHAINRIINEYNLQHALPTNGKVMWY